MKKKTIAVLGGGSAGLTAARTACEMGARVLFFVGARGGRGSLCIEHGYMPSKALFEPIDAMHRAKRHGWLEVRAPADYLARIVAWKDREISYFRRDREETIERLQKKDLSVLEVDARFRSEHELETTQDRYSFDRAIIATGSRPTMPPQIEATAGTDGVWTNVEILANTVLPRVVGGGGGGPAGKRMVVHQAHIEAGIAAENAVTDGHRQWKRRSNLQVVFSDPEFAFAGQSRASAEEAAHHVKTATGRSADVGKLHLAGDDRGFGEFVADAKTGRLLGAGLLCDDAANLIHLPAYAIDHGHTVHQLAASEFYHPTKMELVSAIADALCRELGGTPFCRARE